jgi:site-specific recombinase XerD
MERLYEIQSRIQSSEHEKAIQSTARRYQEWCHHKGWSHPFPIQFIELASYIVDRVNQLKGSAKSARRWTNQLKNYSLSMRQPWIDSTDDKQLLRIIKELEYLDRFPTRRMLPLTKDINVAILDNPRTDELAKTVITVGREGVFRGGEICSSLTKRDFTWSPDLERVTIHLQRSKANRSGDGEYVTLINHGPNSAVVMLRNHFDTYSLWTKPRKHIIFPSYSKSKSLDWSQSLSVNQLRTMIRKALIIIGLEGKKYGAHSLRAGGATDLFRAGVYYPIIKKFGRWKSDTALIYYRDQEHTTETVMKAFAI